MSFTILIDVQSPVYDPNSREISMGMIMMIMMVVLMIIIIKKRLISI